MTRRPVTFSGLIALLLVANSVLQTRAYVARGNYHNEANPGQCVISDTLILSPGKTAKLPNTCANITCDNAEGWATIYGCGVIAPLQNCEWGDYIDIEAPYPQCCARRLICPNAVNQTETTAYMENIENMLKVDTQIGQGSKNI